jgi:PGF-CTERM protein
MRRKRFEVTVLIGVLLVGAIGMGTVSTVIASEEATKTQPVDFSKLIEFLPDAPAGWVLGTDGRTTERWSGAEGWYLKSGTEDVTAYVFISDSYYGPPSISEWQDFESKNESTEAYGKKVVVKRFPAYETYAKAGNLYSYGLYVFINDQFRVDIETNSDRNTLYNLANAIDFNGIAALGAGTEPTTESPQPTEKTTPLPAAKKNPTKPDEEGKTPGFEAVFAIAGLLVVYLLRRRK